MALGNFLQGFTAAQDRNAAAGTRQLQEYGVLQRIVAQQQAAQLAAKQAEATQQYRTEELGLKREAMTGQREATAAQRDLTRETNAARLAEQQASREQRATENSENRKARMNEVKLRLQDSRLAGAERAALARELAGMRADATREAAAARADKPMTEFQGKAALYGSRAAQSDKVLKALEDKVSLTGLAAGQASGMMGNALMSSEQQRITQAQRDFVNAVLRQESGAVISDAEFANAKQQYFPAPGDTKAALDQKRANRQLAIKGFARMSGPKGGADIQAIIDDPLLPGVSPTAVTPQANTAKGQYVEIRRTADGRTLGKKADGTIEEIK
jgi:hypothetical protein